MCRQNMLGRSMLSIFIVSASSLDSDSETLFEPVPRMIPSESNLWRGCHVSFNLQTVLLRLYNQDRIRRIWLLVLWIKVAFGFSERFPWWGPETHHLILPSHLSGSCNRCVVPEPSPA